MERRCGSGLSLVAAGQVFAVVGCEYDPGTSVAFTFGGDVIATGAADANGCAPGSLTTPAVAPGTYQACGVAAGYRTACRSIEGGGHGYRAHGRPACRRHRIVRDVRWVVRTSKHSRRWARTGADAVTLLGVAALAIALGAALKRRSSRGGDASPLGSRSRSERCKDPRESGGPSASTATTMPPAASG